MADFEAVSDQSAYGISVACEGAPKEALIQQHGVGAPMADRDLMVSSPPVVSAFCRRWIVTAFGAGEPSSMRSHATSIMALRRAPLSSARLIGLSGSILARRSRERANSEGRGHPCAVGDVCPLGGSEAENRTDDDRMQSGVELARSMIWSLGSSGKVDRDFL